MFIPVTHATLRYLYGIAALVLDERHFVGTEEEIEQALNTLREQISELPRTLEEICPEGEGAWGALFDDHEPDELWELQGEDLPPPPWEFRVVEEEGVMYLEYRTEEEE